MRSFQKAESRAKVLNSIARSRTQTIHYEAMVTGREERTGFTVFDVGQYYKGNLVGIA